MKIIIHLGMLQVNTTAIEQSEKDSDLAMLADFEKAEGKPCDLYRHRSASLWAWLLVREKLLTGFWLLHNINPYV